MDWFTGHAWSLSVEEQFYLFYPALFILGDRARKLSSFFLVLMVPLIKIYLYYYPIYWIDSLSIFTRIDAIASGCLISLYKDELLKLLGNLTWKFYSAIFVLFFIRFLPAVGEQLHFSFNFIIIPFGLTYGTVANLFIGIILLYSVFGPQKTWFKLLNSKVLNYIGLLSYSIYLW